MGHAQDFEATLPVKQVARNGTQLRLPLVCFSALSRWESRFSSVGLSRLLLGILWVLFGVLWSLRVGWQRLLLGQA